MAKRRIRWTQKAIYSRIKKGFGKGSGADYTPWLRIQDFPSKGRVHRILGMKTDRVHHLFSDLEAKSFHVHDFLPFVADIREQYPLLPLEETLAIAQDCGVVPPTDPQTRQPVVMTTDQYLTVQQAGAFSYLARSIKYSNSLRNLRVLEKLEIERRYWKIRGIDWELVRECDIDKIFVLNVKWVRPYVRIADLYPLTAQMIQSGAASLTRRVLSDDLPLCDATHICDVDLGLIKGSSLAIARHLLATGAWKVDMHRRIEPCERLVMLSVDLSLIQTGGCSNDRTGNISRICA